MVEKTIRSREPTSSADLYPNTKSRSISAMVPMSSEMTLLHPIDHAGIMQDKNVLSSASSSAITSGERTPSNLDLSTCFCNSDRETLITKQRGEGEILRAKDHSQWKEQKIKELSEEIRLLKIENEKLNLKLNLVLSEPNKPKMRQEYVPSNQKQCCAGEQLKGLQECQSSSTCEASPAVRLWTQDQISRLTKLLTATKQIINKYATEHRKFEESNRKLLLSNRFLKQSHASLERQNQILHQQRIEWQTRIGKLQSRNMMLSSREKDCKRRLRRLEERLTGWAVYVLSSGTHRKGDSEEESSSTQVEGEKDEESSHDRVFPEFFRETGEDSVIRSNVTSEIENEKTNHNNIQKLQVSSSRSTMSHPKLKHLSLDHHQQKPKKDKIPHVPHKFRRHALRFPQKDGSPHDFCKFNGKSRRKRVKHTKKRRSRKRPPGGSELAHQGTYCSEGSESNIPTVLASGNNNPNNRN